MDTVFIPLVVYISLLMILGTFGNSAVIFFYGRNIKKTTYTFFIMILAVVDLLTCVMGMPLKIANAVLTTDFDLDAVCKMLWFLMYFTNDASALIISCIAFDRYRKICQPLKCQLSMKQVKLVCFVCVGISMLVSWPVPIFYGQQSVTVVPQDVMNKSDAWNITEYKCTVTKSQTVNKLLLAFRICHFIGFIAVTLCISVIYGLIARRLFYFKQKRRKLSSPSTRRITDETRSFWHFHFSKKTSDRSFSSGKRSRERNPEEVMDDTTFYERSERDLIKISSKSNVSSFAAPQKDIRRKNKQKFSFVWGENGKRIWTTRASYSVDLTEINLNRVTTVRFRRASWPQDTIRPLSSPNASLSIDTTPETNRIQRILSSELCTDILTTSVTHNTCECLLRKSLVSANQLSNQTHTSDSCSCRNNVRHNTSESLSNARGQIDTYVSRTSLREPNVARCTAMMLAVAVVFIVSFLPYHYVTFKRFYLDKYAINLTESEELGLAFGEHFYLMNAAMNPIIYGFFNLLFREFLKRIICSCSSS